MSDHEHEIDIRNNPESRAGDSDTASLVARASDGGAPPKDVLAAGEQPDADPDGTAGGDPLAGVGMSSEDSEEAVTPVDGPTELPDQQPRRRG